MIVPYSSTSMFPGFLMRFAAILVVLSVWCWPIAAEDAAVDGSVTIDVLSMGFNGVGRVGNYAQFAPDGRRVVVANGDGTARIHQLP